MKSNTSLLAGRSIASVMIQRYVFYPLITLTTLAIASLVISLLLASHQSAWWLFLSFVIFIWLFLFILAAGLSYLTFKRIRPRFMNSKERKIINKFINNFGAKYTAITSLKKSPTILSVLLAWRYIKNRGKKPATDIIMEPINDTKDLKQQFQNITALFK